MERYSGSAPSSISLNANIPGVPGVQDSTTIPLQGNSVGDTVYTLISSVFDPRTLQTNPSPGTAIANVYSNKPAKFNYVTLARDYLYRIVFEEFKYRTEPSEQVIVDILDNICDISRMLGIYLTALTLKQSRDPEMFARARALELHDSLPEMQMALSDLPLPRNVTALNNEMIRLAEVSGSPTTYQNVGFLVNGNFAAFNALYNIVRGRSLALNFMRRLYPMIGVVGDPGNAASADFLECFINATHYKLGDGTFAPWVTVAGSSNVPQQLAAAGLLSSVAETAAPFNVVTMTGYAIPGTGYSIGNVRSYVPYLCRWDSSNNIDAHVAGTTASYVPGATITPQRVADRSLYHNVVHEYNIMAGLGATDFPQTVTGFTSATGDLTTTSIIDVDTRHRVSVGMTLGALSYRLDGNMMSGLYGMLSAG